jgi:hypothetical protein
MAGGFMNRGNRSKSGEGLAAAGEFRESAGSLYHGPGVLVEVSVPVLRFQCPDRGLGDCEVGR